MTDLLIGDETFRIEVDGDATKPALLLAHSLGSDLTQWDAQMPALLKSFRVIRYDSRGHGGSTLAGAPYSIARLGRDALGILDALEIDTAHVMGLSMGGAVAQWLLAHAPARIGRAVLANTTARFGATESWNTRIVEVLAHGMSGLTDATMARWFGEDFAARESTQVDAMRAIFEATAPQGYAGCCAAIRDLDLREALRGITAPVLVISGRDDPSIDAADTARLVATIPGAKHVALAARHISNIEAEAAFTKAVVGFLTAKLAAKTTTPVSAPAAAGAKATAARRVGTRRSTAARIPLTTAPTRAVSKSVGKTKAAKAVVAKKPSVPKAEAPRGRKASAAPAKPALAKSESAKRGSAKKADTKKAAVAKPTGKVGKRPSAKALKAMAARPAAKAKVAKGNLAKGKTAEPKIAAKAAPVVRKAASKTAAAPKAATRAAKASAASGSAKVASKKSRTPMVKQVKAKTKSSKPATRVKPSAKSPKNEVARKAPPQRAPARATPKASAKSGAKPRAMTRTKPGRRAS